MKEIKEVLEEVKDELRLTRLGFSRMKKAFNENTKTVNMLTNDVGTVLAKKTYTTKEVADILQVSSLAIHQRLKRKSFPPPDFRGNPNRWKAESINTYLENQNKK